MFSSCGIFRCMFFLNCERSNFASLSPTLTFIPLLRATQCLRDVIVVCWFIISNTEFLAYTRGMYLPFKCCGYRGKG